MSFQVNKIIECVHFAVFFRNISTPYYAGVAVVEDNNIKTLINTDFGKV